ncbi:unnamed protein product, partial [Brassica oleracea]
STTEPLVSDLCSSIQPQRRNKLQNRACDRTHRAISGDKVSPRRRFPDHASKTHHNRASTTDLISQPFYIFLSA